MDDIKAETTVGDEISPHTSFDVLDVPEHAGSSDSMDEDGVEDEEGWEDVQPDVEEVSFKSFFDDLNFQDVHCMLEYCKKTYGFDFLKIKRELDLEFLEMIKLVNYIRTEAKRGVNNPEVFHKRQFEDDQYLQPVLDDDAVLYSLDELDITLEVDDSREVRKTSALNRPFTEDETVALKQDLAAKWDSFRDFYHQQKRKTHTSTIRDQVRRVFGGRTTDGRVYRRASAPALGAQSHDHLLSEESSEDLAEIEDPPTNPLDKALPIIPIASIDNDPRDHLVSAAHHTLPAATTPPKPLPKAPVASIDDAHRDPFTSAADLTLPTDTTQPNRPENDTHYMEAYAQIDIHETMLKDRVRTDAYRNFVNNHSNAFKDKIVLDVGCGSGILSLFCAKAGAKKVYAVDQSDILYKAREIVHDNGFSDTITCIRGKIEHMRASDIPKVDVIISEWMGYGLLYESMLDSVLFARDHFLRPGGLMVPSAASLQIAPVRDEEYAADKVQYWSDVYGFNMSAMASQIHRDAIMHAIPPNAIVGPSDTFLTIDLYTCTRLDLEFTKQFNVSLSQDIDNLSGFGVWFSVDFDVPGALDARSSLTTSPFEPSTHWLQMYLMVDPKMNPAGPLAAGAQITGTVKYAKRQANAREIDVVIEWEAARMVGALGETDLEGGKQTWMIV
ncbi:hypothetical protein MMC13_006060 [Lambiella insularis]|nr:hypothetical protein [Lambiella insularis]